MHSSFSKIEANGVYEISFFRLLDSKIWKDQKNCGLIKGRDIWYIWFQSLANKGAELDKVNLIVGGDVFLDGGEG